MLSQHHRRTLADIEERLRASDPELAHSLEKFNAATPPRRRGFGARRRVIGVIGLWLATMLFTIAFINSSADVLLLASIVLLADAAWWMSCMVSAWVRSHHGDRGR